MDSAIQPNASPMPPATRPEAPVPMPPVTPPVPAPAPAESAPAAADAPTAVVPVVRDVRLGLPTDYHLAPDPVDPAIFSPRTDEILSRRSGPVSRDAPTPAETATAATAEQSAPANRTEQLIEDTQARRQELPPPTAGANGSALDLSNLRGPAAAGVALAGAALATGVSIDLANGRLFEPLPTDRPSVRLSGSPSLTGGTITLSGTF